jgi:hypothetical protein
MITIEKLKAFGANTEEGLGRCMGNEALYLRLVATIPAEKNFDKLKTSIESNNLDEAFDAVHALKGVLGNLALTPMFDMAVKITEPLRNRTAMDYS